MLDSLPLSTQELGLPPKFSSWRRCQEKCINRCLNQEQRHQIHAMPTGCHARGQLVLTYTGELIAVEDVREGDLLMGPDSQPRRVLRLFGGRDSLYLVKPIKGESWVINESHVLSLVKTQQKKNPHYACQLGGEITDVELRTYLHWSKRKKHLHKLFRVGVDFPPTPSDLRIDPYFLGLLLGDGSLRHGISISKPDEEIHCEAARQAERWGLRVRTDGDAVHLVCDAANRWFHNPLTEELRRLGLYGLYSGDKFIPNTYLTTERDSRLRLLAGLLDTDGSLGNGCYDYVSKSERLARQLTFLCRSLGMAAYMAPCEKYCQTGAGGIYYRVSVSGDVYSVPCQIPRKKCGERSQIKNVLRTGFQLSPFGQGEYFGFQLDGDGRYLLGDFTVTHNSGKSLGYVGTALITQERTLILTSTKALQDQIAGDFSTVGIADLRGRSNYKCRMSKSMTCEEGKHAGCQHSKTTACPHKCAQEVAKSSRIVVTNYACWMANNLFGEGLGKFDALVLDEAHSAPDEVCNQIGVEITTEEAYGMLNSAFPEQEEGLVWRDWAMGLVAKAESERQAIAQFIAQTGDGRVSLIRDLQRWASLARKLTLVAGMAGPWVVEASKRGYRLDPLWPSQYAERVLFAGIPKIYSYSATVTPKTLHLMGVRPDELEYYEYASVFPPRRSPVYRIPTCKVDRHMDASAKALWLSRIDQIVSRRRDRKGIIHCVSYQRRDEILKGCESSDCMVGHTPEDTASTLDWFRASQPPLVLVSPAVTTGYDFPGSDCEYQIIAKVPFPDSRAKIMQARSKADRLYIPYLTVQSLIQSTGRGMRYPEDRCECVSPETRLLTAGLVWRESGQLKTGDTLLAFDENGHGRKNPRRWRWSTVLHNEVRRAPRVRVIFEDGEMICTPNHPWLIVAGYFCIGWKLAEDLKPGNKLFRLLNTWREPSTVEQGWLSGFFDGEGCLVLRQGKRNPNVSGIVAAQNMGSTLDHACQMMERCGFSYRLVGQRERMRRLKLLGGQPEILKFLGHIRPVRLLEKFTSSPRNEKISGIAYPRVLAVEKLPDGDICALQTTTATYVAEGMGAHNSFILDDHIARLMASNRDLFLDWWLKLYHRSPMLPDPPPKIEGGKVLTSGE